MVMLEELWLGWFQEYPFSPEAYSFRLIFLFQLDSSCNLSATCQIDKRHMIRVTFDNFSCVLKLIVRLPMITRGFSYRIWIIESSNLICAGNQMTDFQMEYNTCLELVKSNIYDLWIKLKSSILRHL